MTIASPPPVQSEFKQETAVVLSRLRASFSRALNSYGADGTLRSRDLQKRLGIDVRLSWQISRLVNAENPFELSPHVPSANLVQRVLTAAKKHGTPDEPLAAVADSYAAFEQHVQHYAGDRESFDAIMARLIGGETDAQLELAHRRSIFDGHRYVWGLEIDAFVSARVLHPSASHPGGYDCAVLRTRQNLRRLNTDMPLIVDSKSNLSDEALANPSAIKFIPLDPEAYAQHGVPILPAFCSRTELPLRQYKSAEHGSTIIEWMSDAVGKPSTVTLAFGNIDVNVPLTNREEGKKGFIASINFATPTRLAIQDMIIHRPTFGSLTAVITRWGHSGHIIEQRQPLPKLPCNDRMRFIGSGESATHVSEVPGYTEMVRLACDRAGWNIEEMDVYRVRIEYPLLDTLSVINCTFEKTE